MASSSKLPADQKLKTTQDELRRIMKEKQQTLRGKEKKIDSPLAKYNDLGHLLCVLCSCRVKNELLWPAHVNGKSHKQNLEDLKRQKEKAVQQTNFKTPTPPAVVGLKRPADLANKQPDTKRIKGHVTSNSVQNSPLPKDFFDTQPNQRKTNTSLPSINASPVADEVNSDEDEDMEEEGDTDDDKNTNGNSLNKGSVGEVSQDEPVSITNNVTGAMKSNSVDALPEGFFDDPIQDAKVRKVEYKDPVEEEWERFQREIADATSKAQAIVAEEEEESTAERQIDEIDEQIHNWARVDALQCRKEELQRRQRENSVKNPDKEENTSADEQEFEEFLDWRAKGSWT